MPNTPLNPDARRAAFEAVQAIDGPASIGSMEIVDAAVSAYLAVAQPVVNSVEELDALPAGSVILDGEGAVVWQMLEKSRVVGSEWGAVGEEMTFTANYLKFPARVLYRPTEESINGR